MTKQKIEALIGFDNKEEKRAIEYGSTSKDGELRFAALTKIKEEICNLFKFDSIIKTVKPLVVAAAMMFVGCEKEEVIPPPPPIPDDPLPFLKVGNEWVYEIYDLDENFLGFRKEKIVKKCFFTGPGLFLGVPNEEILIYHIVYSNLSNNIDSCFYNDFDVRFCLQHNTITGNNHYFNVRDKSFMVALNWLPIYCQVGWKNERPGHSLEVVSISDTVYTSAGTFSNCIHLFYKNEKSDHTLIWLDFNVGFIKFESTITNVGILHSTNFHK